eukprot:UC4_evm3s714
MQSPDAKIEHASFLMWWARFIDEHEQISTGFLCNISNDTPTCKCSESSCDKNLCLKDVLHSCVAPTFATNMIKHLGLNWTWHLNRTAQRTILDLQLPTGLWSDGNKPGYHDVDALFIATRTLEWNPDRRGEVKAACYAFLGAVKTFDDKEGFRGRGLNDAELVVEMYTNTHDLVAVIDGISVCGQAFPDMLKTIRPWVFSGDRAPFI